MSSRIVGRNHESKSQSVSQNIYSNNDEKDAIKYYKDLKHPEQVLGSKRHSDFGKCWGSSVKS